MADAHIRKALDLIKAWCPGVFEVADYEYEVKITKNKMADLIWQTAYKKTSNLV